MITLTETPTALRALTEPEIALLAAVAAGAVVVFATRRLKTVAGVAGLVAAALVIYRLIATPAFADLGSGVFYGDAAAANRALGDASAEPAGGPFIALAGALLIAAAGLWDIVRRKRARVS